MSSPSAIRVARTFPLLIAALSMMGPFAIDTYLPSFPEIGQVFRASPAQVQQSLTAFLLPFAFMSLWHGALSDSFGRRPVIIINLAILCVASIGCAFATSIEMLCALRVLQGLAAGVFVVGRAVVRDVYEGPAAQRVIAQVSVLFAIAPAVAPVLGGQLHEYFGWQSVFIFLALFSGLIALICVRALPETHPPSARHPFHPGPLLRAYGTTLRHPGFFSSALAAALLFTAMFLYVAAAPALLLGHLHLKETEFLWLFGPITAGMSLGSFLAGKLAGRLSSTRTLLLAASTMATATAANLLLHALQPASLPWSMVPLFFYAIGVCLALPVLTLIGLDFFPARRGLASSCQAFLLTGLNALTAGVLAPLGSTTPFKLAAVSAGLFALGLACLPFIRKGPHPETALPEVE